MKSVRNFIATFAVLGAFLVPNADAAARRPKTGAEIYRAQCLHCHGAMGEGVADKYDETLYGDRSVEQLARVIERTMPEDKDKKCSPEEAQLVAQYIHETFYSPEARARNTPPRVELSRLTIPQYLNAVADLVASFRPAPKLDSAHGLTGYYYKDRRFRDDNKALERVDPVVQFSFADKSPDSSITNHQEFAIRWRGSVVPEVSGVYEFQIKTENGAKLWVNDNEKEVIDAWVASGGAVREEKTAVRLLAGRAYPIQLDLFKFKDKSASIVLEWKPPHKAFEPIPSHALRADRAPESLIVSTAFPADDASVGYERGASISKAWDRAATYAAIEVAGKLASEINSFAGTRNDAPDRKEKIQRFCEKFAERAFRRPLSPEQKEFFVTSQFAAEPDLEKALKRSILLTLKSPRFLYPEVGGEKVDDYTIASRLSFALWDSIPDTVLLSAAANGQLRTRQEIVDQTRRMLGDVRAKQKLHGFFDSWLELEEAEDLSKDPKTYPDFTEQAMADLRTSLEMFIDEVVWSDSSDYRELLLADYVYLNPRLAQMYGGQIAEDGGFQKVRFAKQRTGVITHPYLLAMLAYYKNTSPIHRGVFLTRNIVGRALKPPPMAIEFMDGRFDPSLTMREKVTELTSSPNCMSCHTFINPLGFSLENFDAVGRFRTIDNNKKVDPTGRYVAPDGKSVRLRGPRDVAEYAAKSPDAHRAFVQQLFHHTIKQSVAAYGPQTLEDLRKSFTASKFNIRELLVNIVATAALHEPQTGGPKIPPAPQTAFHKGTRHE